MPDIPTPPREKACSQKRGKVANVRSSRQSAKKTAILIRMQFLNDIIKSRHGFKTAQKLHKFTVFIKKNSKFMKFLSHVLI